MEIKKQKTIKNQNKENSLLYLPRLILTVSMLVSFGALAGAVGYLISHPDRYPGSPIINPPAINGISIQTDKAEYKLGETIKITVSNDLNKPMYLEGCNPFVVEKKSEKWTDVWYKECFWEGNSQKINPDNVENFSIEAISGGLYRIRVAYYKDCTVDNKPISQSGCGQANLIYSATFKVNDKNVSDPRCGQKVRFSGNCEIAVIGFEFDPSLGKCITKNGSCKVETPFSTPEECQKICETGIVSGNELKFETILKVGYSGISERKNYTINSQMEWVSLLEKMGIDRSVSRIMPVDFSKDMIITTFQGEYSTGGYDIEITKIEENENNIEVLINETSHGKDCMVTEAFTRPYHIIKMQKTSKEILFNVNKKINNCSSYSLTEDFCDVENEQWGNAGGIYPENYSKLANVKKSCEQKNDCAWKDLGGKISSFYACCPKDLKSVITDENRKIFKRCLIIID